MPKVTDWIQAFRLRTLPLAFACIGMGAFLAYGDGHYKAIILFLSLLTTLFLQVLSNLANDYGDSLSGVDHAERKGPSRTVQSGRISRELMRKALVIFAVLAFASGILLILIAFPGQWILFSGFLFLGLASIAAAIKYTVGKNPYGYVGLGDLFVLIFFGLVGVLGSYFLHTQAFRIENILPALSCGLFAVGVLNVNNIRDIESDRLAGKFSIPVRIGKQNAVRYHLTLLVLGWFSAVVYTVSLYDYYDDLVYFICFPIFVSHARKVVITKDSASLDPTLRQLALSTLLFVLLFGVGRIF